MDIEANDSGRFPTVVVKTADQPGRTAAVCTGEIIFVAEAGKSFSLEFKCVCCQKLWRHLTDHSLTLTQQTALLKPGVSKQSHH